MTTEDPIHWQEGAPRGATPAQKLQSSSRFVYSVLPGGRRCLALADPLLDVGFSLGASVDASLRFSGLAQRRFEREATLLISRYGPAEVDELRAIEFQRGNPDNLLIHTPNMLRLLVLVPARLIDAGQRLIEEVLEETDAVETAK